MLSRATNDMDNIGMSLQQTLSQLISSVLTVVGVVGMMLWLSWLLAVIAVITVITASGADALCSQLLAYRRGRLDRDRIYPPERDFSADEPKVGVFVCRCGANIAPQ